LSLPPRLTSPLLIGVLCGATAALSWAAGFVAARHGVLIGLSPSDLAFHRFFWAGLVLLPFAWRQGFGDLGGIGWPRGLVIFVLAGPFQAVFSATGFSLTPLGHGAVIQPAMAALGGLLLATWILREPLYARRVFGAGAILVGLLLLGAEAVATIGARGLGGDLLFALAGVMWALFGTVLRKWNLRAQPATLVVSALSLLIYSPAHAVLFGFDRMLAVGWWENILQIVVQGGFAGALSVHLFSRAIILLGAGRAAAFPAMVPAATLLIGAVALWELPTLVQLAGLAAVAVGFRFTIKP
jgi:drug/metabolite transporter (DMT)-like permease